MTVKMPLLVPVPMYVSAEVSRSHNISASVSARDGGNAIVSVSVVVSWSQCQCQFCCQLELVGVSVSVVVSWSQLESVPVSV